MEVSLPISSVGKQPAAAEGASASSLSRSTGSVVLPLSFILVGLVALCVGMGWLVAQPVLLATYHYNQNVIAATHLFVLGWVCSVVMGSMYQLVPVALETKLYSANLARWHFVMHCVGFMGMVWMFQRWDMKQVGHFGCVLTFGIGLFVYNLGRTLRNIPKWNVTAWAVAAALCWISLAVCVGLSVATAKCMNSLESSSEPAGVMVPLIYGLRWLGAFMARFEPIGTMHAHAHLGALGCFLMLIVGVSYKLIPMFALSEVLSRRRAVWSIILLNVGLAGAFFTIIAHSAMRLAFTLVLAIALGLYGWELVAILRHRKRRALDWGIKYFLTAIAMLLPLTLLAVMLSWPGLPLTTFTGQLENLYGFLGFIGVISLAIIGMLYKIIPFLVWFKSYSRQIGRARVPALAEMYSDRWQAIGYGAYIAGLAITSVAILLSSESCVRIGCIFLALSLATFLLNVGAMLGHLYRPKLQPLTPRTHGSLKLA